MVSDKQGDKNATEKKLRIGIPRGFFFHIYSTKMLAFFEKLGVEVVLSPKTNRKILENGIALSIDETCLAEKIYIGHVKWLAGKCDMIFVPRIHSFSVRDTTCPKFWATHDIARTLVDAKYIDFNIDSVFGKSEKGAYISLGKQLGFSHRASKAAYKHALETEQKIKDEQEQKILKQLESDKIKIAIIAHAYNASDEYIGMPIIRSLKEQGAEVIVASELCGKKYKEGHKDYATTFNWFHNKELLGVFSWLKDKVDGVVLVSVFPCGPDSMTNELLRLNKNNLPMMSLIIDEVQASAGVETRLESFMDVLTHKRQGETK